MKSYRWLFWTLAVGGLILDQSSKYLIFRALYDAESERGGEVSLVDGVFKLEANYVEDPRIPKFWSTEDGLLTRLRTWSSNHIPVVNHGALFGIGGRDDKGHDLNQLFAIISVAAALCIAFFSTRPGIAQDRFLCFALGLILAGTLGNFYDRLVFHGVRDFLHWYKWYDWPVFNVADCCLVVGAGTLLIHAFFAPEPVEQPAKPQQLAVEEAAAITQN